MEFGKSKGTISVLNGDKQGGGKGSKGSGKGGKAKVEEKEHGETDSNIIGLWAKA